MLHPAHGLARLQQAEAAASLLDWYWSIGVFHEHLRASGSSRQSRRPAGGNKETHHQTITKELSGLALGQVLGKFSGVGSDRSDFRSDLQGLGFEQRDNWQDVRVVVAVCIRKIRIDHCKGDTQRRQMHGFFRAARDKMRCPQLTSVVANLEAATSNPGPAKLVGTTQKLRPPATGIDD